MIFHCIGHSLTLTTILHMESSSKNNTNKVNKDKPNKTIKKTMPVNKKETENTKTTPSLDKNSCEVNDFFDHKIKKSDMKAAWGELNGWTTFKDNFLELDLDKQNQLISIISDTQCVLDKFEEDVLIIRLHLEKRLLFVLRTWHRNNFEDVYGHIYKLNTLTKKYDGIVCDKKIKYDEYLEKIKTNFIDNTDLKIFDIVEYLEKISREYEAKKITTIYSLNDDFDNSKVNYIKYGESDFLELEHKCGDRPKEDMLNFAIERSKKITNGTKIKIVLLKKYINQGNVDRKTKDNILKKEVVEMMNKISPKNKDRIIERIQKLEFTTKEDIDIYVNELFNKARTAKLYTNLIAEVCKKSENFKVDDEKINTFKYILLSKCQRTFLDGIANEKKNQTNQVERTSRFTFMFFLGDLYLNKLLTKDIIDKCLNKLLKAQTDDSNECFYHLLNRIIKDYKERKDPIFLSLKKTIIDNSVREVDPDTFSFRIRHLFTMLVDELNKK